MSYCRHNRKWSANAQLLRIVWLSTASAIVILGSGLLKAGEPEWRHPGLVQEKPASGRSVKTSHGYMVPYERTIPGTEVSFRMLPVPGGTFVLGSPDSEQGRNADEGPPHPIHVAPFWMARTEVSWAEYKEFMHLYSSLKRIQSARYLLADAPAEDLSKKTPEQIAVIQRRAAKRAADQASLRARLASPKLAALKAHLDRQPNDLDAITAPTELYEPEITYEYGSEPNQPAVTMTQYAAKQYSKWLSKLTGTFYRLPSEAEWEYACRAGTTTAYHFGDDPSLLGEYAWYSENSESQLHAVGTKKPNAWGLHDMHGSVAELVLDAYSDEGYAIPADPAEPITVSAAIRWPQQQYPRTVRGGSWEDDATACRSAARIGSDDEVWKEDDPNSPKSPWWYTTDPTRGIGFRLVEPLVVPSDENRAKFWEIDVDDIRFDVEDRLDEGRGVRDNAHADLPEVIRQSEQIDNE